MMKPLSIARVLAREAMLSGRLRMAFPAGALLPFSVLLLPSTDPARDATAASSFSMALFPLLVWFFALTAPAYIASPDSGFGLGSFLRSRPVPAWVAFMGRSLAGIRVSLLWWAVTATATWAALTAAYSRAPGGTADTQRRVAPARAPAEGTVLSPGGEAAVFSFEGLEEEDFESGPIEAGVHAAFKIANPEPGVMGAEIRVRISNPRTGASSYASAEVLNPRRPLSFAIPRETVFPGGAADVAVSMGPSPFTSEFKGECVFLLAKGRGRFAGFAVCALCAGILAIGLSLVSSAVSQAVSFQVAALFGSAFGLAGAASGYAGRMARSLIDFPHSHGPAEAVSGVKVAILEAAGFVCSALPDLPSYVPARDFAGGFDVSSSFIASAAASAALLALAGACVGSLASEAGRGR